MATKNKPTELVGRSVIPQISPYGLIQEQLWPNEWLILVSCILLNQTSRKQVDKIFPEFLSRWNKPQEFLSSSCVDVKSVIATLGFKNRRTKLLFDMTEAYLNSEWSHASQLPGIGDYGARTWEIFCVNVIGDSPPRDHALVKYYEWVKNEKEVSTNI